MAANKPTRKELEHRITLLEKELAERERAEMAYRSMVESSADSLYMADRDCRYLFVNSRHLASHINLSIEKVIGRPYSDFHSPEKSEEFAAMVNEVFTRGISIQKEYNSNGDGRHFLRTFSPVREPGSPDKIAAVIVNSKDITEIKLIEYSLKRSEAIYRNFINNAKQIIFLKDDQFRYLIVNKSLLKLCGMKEEDFLGKTDFELLPAVTAEKMREADVRALKSGFLTMSEETIGSSIYEINILPVELPDGKMIISGMAKDITDRIQAEKEKKKLETRFLHAQKMEAIGTLAGGIAHNFNNLLTGIQGYISLMLFDADANHPFYEKLKNIEQHVQTGAELTKQLLGFARGGKHEIKPVNLNEIIGKTAGMFGHTRKEITIQQNFQPDLWTVEADWGQIEQVLMNLYVNAWQAMPEGGCLYLETENVELDETFAQPYFVEHGRYVKITVADTGVGMDEYVRARLFEPFFTTKEMGRGTGLGLATVYGIVKAHRGAINVYSEKGQGTIFKIYLPASDKNVEAEKIMSQELLRGTETILLVDDEETVINVASEVLESLGYLVYTAESGREAVDIYKEKKEEISLIILDMIMPDMGGAETFDLLKKINSDVRVILSSGYSLNQKVSDVLKRGCRSFLQKPFRFEDLSRIVRETLAEKTI